MGSEAPLRDNTGSPIQLLNENAEVLSDDADSVLKEKVLQIGAISLPNSHSLTRAFSFRFIADTGRCHLCVPA